MLASDGIFPSIALSPSTSKDGAFGCNPTPSTVNGLNLFLPRLRKRSRLIGLPATTLPTPFSVIRVRRYLNDIRMWCVWGQAIKLRVLFFFAMCFAISSTKPHKHNPQRVGNYSFSLRRMATACALRCPRLLFTTTDRAAVVAIRCC